MTKFADVCFRGHRVNGQTYIMRMMWSLGPLRFFYPYHVLHITVCTSAVLQTLKPVCFFALDWTLPCPHAIFSWSFLPLLLLGFYSCHLGGFKTWRPLHVVVCHLLQMAFSLFDWILGCWKTRGPVLWVTQCSPMLQTVWLSMWIMVPYPDMSAQIYLFLLILK